MFVGQQHLLFYADNNGHDPKKKKFLFFRRFLFLLKKHFLRLTLLLLFPSLERSFSRPFIIMTARPLDNEATFFFFSFQNEFLPHYNLQLFGNASPSYYLRGALCLQPNSVRQKLEPNQGPSFIRSMSYISIHSPVTNQKVTLSYSKCRFVFKERDLLCQEKRGMIIFSFHVKVSCAITAVI